MLIPLIWIYLRTLAFILVIAVVVQFTEMVVRKTSPALYRLLGIFLTTDCHHCAVLGVALLNITRSSLLQSALYGFSRRRRFFISDGSVCRHRNVLPWRDVPAPFRGNAIAFSITAGLMSGLLRLLKCW
ncbi:hypothetical protein KCP76_23455 [Salmonella enterica subsp. enterica serovar Weltevreden]|nr:hypothetical protein KCP76_23455 [Salmonella enterica subsp. enterica serovar Weltevreden]